MMYALKSLIVITFYLVTGPIALTVWLLDKTNSRQQAFSASAKLLSLIPGLLGRYIRTSFYKLTLDQCHYDLSVDFGSFFSKKDAIIGRRVVIGSYSIIGKATIGSDVMIASRVSVLSGKHQHTGSQEVYEKVIIKKNCWIGENAIVMANIGYNCIVSAGSVVSKAMPCESLATGNPARFSPRNKLATMSGEDKKEDASLYIAHFRTSNFIGGPEKQIISHLYQLKNSPHKSALISFDEPGGHKLKDYADKLGIECVLLPAGAKNIKAVYQKLKAWLDENPVDLLCTHDYKATFYGLLLRNYGAYSTIGFSRGATSENLRVKLYMQLDNQLLRYVDAIVAVSRSQADKLNNLKIFHNNVHVIENAVTSEAFNNLDESISSNLINELNLASDSKLILSAGRLSEEKGHRFLIEAFNKISSDHPDWHLVLAGDGPLMQELKDLASDLGSRNVHFLGFRSDISSLYQQSKIMVLPSLSEGLPNAVLEAMTYDCVVISSAVGGVPDIITDSKNGLLVPASDSTRLSKAIIRAITEPVLCEQLISEGKKTLEESFSATRQAKRLISLYDEVYSKER